MSRPPESQPEPSPAPTPGSDARPVPPPPPRPSGPPPGRPGSPARSAGGRSTTGVAVGRIVEVEVISVSQREVEVRLLDGRTGVIPRSEFEAEVTVGTTIPAALLARDDPRGRVVLSHAWAIKQVAWERVDAACSDRTPLTGTVTKVVKGGVVVDVGLRAFMPMSLLADPPGSVEPKALVGAEVSVLVTEADRAADRIVVSRRDFMRKERRKEERDRLAALVPGSRVTGTVVTVADYGAVVDVGGVRGLVHRSELTWHRFDSVADVVSVGQEVSVEVLDVQKSKRRVSLSLKRTAPDPYEGLEAGQILDATVTRVVEYGAFMRLDDSGAEGLVHMSELSDVPGYRPDQLVAPGEQVMVKVMDVDRKRHRMALSVRRVLVDD